jgi:hypothetical protein
MDDPLAAALDGDVSTVVLVEGRSDQAALEALAARRGRDLAADGVAIVPVGGATTVGRFVTRYGPDGLGLRLAGLCDAAEVPSYARALRRAGLGVGTDLGRADLEALGFYVCDADLEDELIRALGADAVVRVIEREGELRSLRTLQQQPAQRARSVEAQLHRFMGSKGGRKLRYARSLVDDLDLDAVPRPLDALLAHV